MHVKIWEKITMWKKYRIFLTVRKNQKFTFTKNISWNQRIFVKEVRYTVWKFHEFSVNSILRESNLGEFKSFKTAVFVILGAMHFVDLVYSSFQKMQKFIKFQIQSSQMC